MGCGTDARLSIDLFENTSFYFDIFEKRREVAVMRYLCAHLIEGDTFVDIGAYFGHYSILASKLVGTIGRVYAFEPDPVALRKLRMNARLNGAGNIRIFPWAVSDKASLRELAAPSFGSSVSRISQGNQDRGLESYRVRTIGLDEFEKGHIISHGILMIDVEGHEVEVIKGAEKTISEDGVVTLLDLHVGFIMNRGIDPVRFYQGLFDFGKNVFLLHDSGEITQASKETPMTLWSSHHLVMRD